MRSGPRRPPGRWRRGGFAPGSLQASDREEAEAVAAAQFHVASREALNELRAEFAEFDLVYELASQALRSGDLEAAHRFPPGCFPPALS